MNDRLAEARSRAKQIHAITRKGAGNLAHATVQDALLLDALAAELKATREFVVAHTLVERGVNDFDLQAEAVERLRRAAEHPSVEAIIRDTLAGGEQT